MVVVDFFDHKSSCTNVIERFRYFIQDVNLTISHNNLIYIQTICVCIFISTNTGVRLLAVRLKPLKDYDITSQRLGLIL